MFQYEEGRFYLNNEERQKVAEVTFKLLNENVYVLDSTWVDPSLRGRGIAAQLVEAVVNKAKTEGKMIIPLCSYARVLFERNKAYQEIWYKD